MRYIIFKFLGYTKWPNSRLYHFLKPDLSFPFQLEIIIILLKSLKGERGNRCPKSNDCFLGWISCIPYAEKPGFQPLQLQIWAQVRNYQHPSTRIFAGSKLQRINLLNTAKGVQEPQSFPVLFVELTTCYPPAFFTGKPESWSHLLQLSSIYIHFFLSFLFSQAEFHTSGSLLKYFSSSRITNTEGLLVLITGLLSKLQRPVTALTRWVHVRLLIIRKNRNQSTENHFKGKGNSTLPCHWSEFAGD